MFFDIIKKEGDAMSGLISDLLTLAGADSHSFTIRAASCEPDTLLLDTFEAFELLAREKDIIFPYSCLKKKQHPSSATAIASVRCCLFYFIMPLASVLPEAGLPSP